MIYCFVLSVFIAAVGAACAVGTAGAVRASRLSEAEAFDDIAADIPAALDKDNIYPSHIRSFGTGEADIELKRLIELVVSGKCFFVILLQSLTVSARKLSLADYLAVDIRGFNAAFFKQLAHRILAVAAVAFEKSLSCSRDKAAEIGPAVVVIDAVAEIENRSFVICDLLSLAAAAAKCKHRYYQKHAQRYQWLFHFIHLLVGKLNGIPVDVGRVCHVV